MGKYWTDHHAAIFGADPDKPPTIKLGSQGDIVKEWQFILGKPETGNFDKDTNLATKAWQVHHGLKADGVVGPKTWELAHRLIAQNSGHVPSPNAPTPATQVIPGTSAQAPVEVTQIKRGDGAKNNKADVVKRWQVLIAESPADGEFGSKTHQLTKAWQKKRGLKPDGVVGPQTWQVALGGAPVVNPETQTATPVTQQAVTPWAYQAPAKDSSHWWAWVAGILGVTGAVFYGTLKPAK